VSSTTHSNVQLQKHIWLGYSLY